MRKILFIFGLFLFSTPVFADYLIYETKSKVAVAVTSDEPPNYDASIYSVVKVPAKTGIPSGIVKIDPVSKVFSAASLAEIQTFQDSVNPRQAQVRDLTTAISDLQSDPGTSAKMQAFLDKLKKTLT